MLTELHAKSAEIIKECNQQISPKFAPIFTYYIVLHVYIYFFFKFTLIINLL